MITYGDRLNTTELASLLAFLFESNLANEVATGERPTPVCIWGTHGLGKTASVVSFARARGWKLAYCAPAQFEEIGDLHGLPMKVDPDPSRMGDEYTAYLPPEWVPREEGPGILLLDDVNRADDRILRGIMQLLQNFEMFSWSLPPRWQIVCTANPEGSDYSVTPMDDAMLTRMMHVTLGLDIKAWAAWATTAGVDARGVDFVLTYPEVVTGKRSTPRSLVQVFAHLARIADWKANLSRVATIARSALDDTTVNALLAYVNEGLEHLITAEEILEADPFEGVRRRVAAAARGAGRTVRLDRLSAICMRLVLTLGREAYATPTALHKANVTALLMMEEIPTDLAFSVHRDLLALGGNRAKLISDPALAKRVMQAL